MKMLTPGKLVHLQIPSKLVWSGPTAGLLGLSGSELQTVGPAKTKG